MDFRPAIRRALAGIEPTLGTGEGDWVSLSSSNVAAAKYNALSQVLTIRFISGGEYEYSGVSRGVYEGLLNASSAGKYVYYNISHAYPYARVG